MYLSHLYIIFHFILFTLVFIVTSVELAFTSLGDSSSQLYTNCIIIIIIISSSTRASKLSIFEI